MNETGIDPHYVVGFVFSQDLRQVALLRKTHPDWMAGKLNGLGGRRQVGEDVGETMAREAQEQTGLVSKNYDWLSFGRLDGHSLEMEAYRVYCFSIQCRLETLKVPPGLEPLEIVNVVDIYAGRADLVAHVDWMISMALSQLTAGYSLQAEVLSEAR